MLFISLLFVQLLIFIGLALLLKHVLTGHIREATAHLQKLTTDYTQKLDEVKKQKEEAEKYYKETLLKSKEEADQLKHRIIEEGHTAKNEMLQQTHQQVEEIVKRAQTAAELIMQDQYSKVESLALDKMQQLMFELLPGKMSEETHSQWVDELIQNGFERLSALNVPESVKEVKAVTAFSLKSKDKNEIEQQLSKKLGRTIHIKEEVDPKLILGVRLNIDSLVIDGSLQFRIQEWLRHAKSEDNIG